MYKILVFVAFVSCLSKSEACPSDYSHGKNDDYCYHIGKIPMSHYEAEIYCESMNLGELAHQPLPNSLKNRLKHTAEIHPTIKWWLADCKELEFVNIEEGKFKTNGLNCSEKRMPICETWR